MSNVRRGSRWPWMALLGVAGLHLGISLSFHLSPDEAHYALYAYHLDWSYYDHPPLVGWLQWPFLQLGASDVLMRCLPMLSWLLTAYGLKHLTLSVYPSLSNATLWHVRWEWWLFGLGLLPHLLGIAWVPDTLLMPLTCAVMWTTWQLCRPNSDHRLRLWLCLGLLLGLSGLAKYTAILLVLGAALALVHAHGLRLFTHKGVYAALGVAVVCVIPVFYWNYTHDWASFTYQLNHAAGQSTWQGLNWLRYTLVIWLAFGLVLPWAWLSAVMNPPAAVEGVCATVSPHRFGLYFGLPSLLLWLYLSGRGSTLPHWATPAVVALLPLGAWGCARLVTVWPRVLKSVLLLQALLCGVFIFIMLAGGLPSSNAAVKSPNPFADLYGWREAAEKARELAEANNAQVLSVTNWTLASRVAWYARPMPVKLVRSRADQFDLWFGRLQATDRVIWINWSQMQFDPPTLSQQFETCELLAEMPAMHWDRPLAQFDFWLCQGWQGKQSSQP